MLSLPYFSLYLEVHLALTLQVEAPSDYLSGTAINDTSSVTAAASTWDSMWKLGSEH